MADGDDKFAGKGDPGDDKFASKGDPGDDKFATKGDRAFGTPPGLAQAPFGAGYGWAIVAFISPVGLDVNQLAARMLVGSRGLAGSAQNDALGNVVARAQAAARKRAVARVKAERITKQAERIAKQVAKGGKRRKTPR